MGDNMDLFASFTLMCYHWKLFSLFILNQANNNKPVSFTQPDRWRHMAALPELGPGQC